MVARLRSLVSEVVAGFTEHELMPMASTIAFRVLFAAIPFALFVLALLGFLSLDEVWTRDVAPDLRASVSPAAFTLIDDAVRNVLSGRQAFWLTIGFGLAIWELSGAVRAAVVALDRIYAPKRRRDGTEAILRSLVLALGVAACLIGAAALVRLAPLALNGLPQAIDAIVFVIRWAAALALLTLGVALVVRFGPASPQSAGWVTAGSLLITLSWVVASLGFAAYVTRIADYGSAFGSLAAVMVLLAYLYVAAIAFLIGAQVDAVARRRSKG